MFGDDPNDLFLNHPFQTGEAAHATEEQYGKVKLAGLAYDQAIRKLQSEFHAATSDGRNYPMYLRSDPWNPERHIVGLTLEDRVERRPLAVQQSPAPLAGGDPIPAFADALAQQYSAARAALGLP